MNSELREMRRLSGIIRRKFRQICREGDGLIASTCLSEECDFGGMNMMVGKTDLLGILRNFLKRPGLLSKNKTIMVYRFVTT